MTASRKGHADVVRLLLEAGANVRAANMVRGINEWYCCAR